jgi:Fe-S-cluster-containing hydrogenase component 2
LNTTSISRDNRSIAADSSKCAGCLTCMLRCSFRHDRKFNLSRSRILVSRLVGAENEFDISFSPECDACLICARYCPYDALTAHKQERET